MTPGLDQIAVRARGGVEPVARLEAADGRRPRPKGRSRRCAAIWRSGSSSARRTTSAPVASSGASPVGLDRRLGVQQRDAAAGEDPLVERRAGCLHRVLDPVHALGQLGLGGGADPDHGDPAAQPGHALAELVALVLVEVAVLLELGADLPDPPLDRLRVAAAADDRRRLPVDDDALRPPELPEPDVVQREAELLRDVRSRP